MKTSNKILLGFISVLGLCMLSILIFAKSSLINVEDQTVNGNGKIIKKDYNIGEISFFRTGGSFEVYLSEGEPELIIEADENIHAFLRPHDDNWGYTKNADGESVAKRELRIMKDNDIRLKPTQQMKVYLTSPMLEKIVVSGNGTIRTESPLNSVRFEVRSSGNSDIDLKLKTGDLKIDANGNSQVNINGEAGNTVIEASGSTSILLESINAVTTSIDMDGSSNLSISGLTKDLMAKANGSSYISAAGLQADEASLFLGGSSRMFVHANTKLHVEASGSSDIVYTGDPQVTQSVSAGARLKKQ